MKTKRKLILGCVLALAVGAFSISPLMLAMVKTTKAELGSKPHFGLDITYAFVQFSNSNTFVNDTAWNMPAGPGPFLEEVVFYNSTIYADAESDLPDAVIEYFLFQIYSDKGPLENKTQWIGASFNSSFTVQIGNSFVFSRGDWFDSKTSGGGTFYENGLNWLPNVTGGYSGSTNCFSMSGEPETIFINVSRIGSVIFNQNLTVVALSTAEFIGQIQLEKYKDGFLYNTMFSEEDLSQSNPLEPKAGMFP